MLGEGSKNNPFIIQTAEDLWNVRNVTFAYYELGNDIDLSQYNTGEGWKPIPTFTGSFQGNGYTIRNLYIYSNEQNIGLFGIIKNDDPEGTVSNLGGYVNGFTIENAIVYGQGATAGVICGQAINSAMITNIKIKNAYVDVVAGRTGGIAGYIEDYHRSATYSDIYRKTHIHYCLYEGEIKNTGTTGGICGYQYSGSVIGNTFEGNITTTTGTVGGITGLVGLKGEQRDNYAVCQMNVVRGSIKGRSIVGGVVGESSATTLQVIARNVCNATIESSLTGQYNQGTIYIGGICGKEGDGVVRDNVYNKTLFPLTSDDDLVNYRIVCMKGVSGTDTEMKTPSFYKHIGYAFHPGDIWFREGEPSYPVKYRNMPLEDQITLEGDGTVNNPYIIRTASQLHYMKSMVRMRQVGGGSTELPFHGYWELGNDIDLGIFPFNVGEGWDAIFDGQYNVLGGSKWVNAVQVNPVITDGFTGYFDGKDFAIKNMTINNPISGTRVYHPNTVYNGTVYATIYQPLSLFGYIHHGTVKNLKIEDVNIAHTRDVFTYWNSQYEPDPSFQISVDPLAAVIRSPSHIERVTVTGKIESSYMTSGFTQAVAIDGVRYYKEGSSSTYTEPHVNDMSVIKDCSSSLDITFIGDKANYMCSGFITSITNVDIINSYSSSNIMHKPVANVTTHVSPFVYRTIYQVAYTGKPSIQSCYFNRDTANFNGNVLIQYSGTPPTFNFDVTGLNTEQMKLQSSFEGWDFLNKWMVDGINFPILQALKEFTEPTNLISRHVTATINPVNGSFTWDKVLRRIKTHILQSYMQKAKSDKFTVKTATAQRNAIVDELRTVSFNFKTPILYAETLQSSVEEFNTSVTTAIARGRQYVHNAIVEPLRASVEAKSLILFTDTTNPLLQVTLNQGQMTYTVNNDILLVEILLNGAEVYSKHITDYKSDTYVIDQSVLNAGANPIEVIAYYNDSSGTQRTEVKKFSARKETLDTMEIGDTLVINKKPFTITNVLSSGGNVTLTVDQNLTETIASGTLIEAVKPKYKAYGKLYYPDGAGVSTPMELINIVYRDGKVEEEYELTGEGSVMETIVEMQDSDIADTQEATLYNIKQIFIPKYNNNTTI